MQHRSDGMDGLTTTSLYLARTGAAHRARRGPGPEAAAELFAKTRGGGMVSHLPRGENCPGTVLRCTHSTCTVRRERAAAKLFATAVCLW